MGLQLDLSQLRVRAPTYRENISIANNGLPLLLAHIIKVLQLLLRVLLDRK